MPDGSGKNGELVEVDFTAKREPDDLATDLLADLNSIKSELDRLAKVGAEGEMWRRWRDRANRLIIRDLRRQLAEERAAGEPTEEEVLVRFGSSTRQPRRLTWLHAAVVGNRHTALVSV